MRDHEAGHFLYETMFVWNEFMTRGIRNHLKNTLWTVALVYGFFKQVTSNSTLMLSSYMSCSTKGSTLDQFVTMEIRVLIVGF